MNYFIVAVKDLAIEAFQPPAFCRAKGEAMRGFTDAVNDPANKQLNQHPEDFELWHIGYFNDQTGELAKLELNERLARGVDVLAQRQ